MSPNQSVNRSSSVKAGAGLIDFTGVSLGVSIVYVALNCINLIKFLNSRRQSLKLPSTSVAF